MISYLIDFIGTTHPAHHFCRRAKLISCFVFFKQYIEKLFCYFCLDKLIYFLNNKIYLPIGNLPYPLSCNLLILGYFPGIEQSRISYFQALNTLRLLELLGLCTCILPGRHTAKSCTVSHGSQLHWECPSSVG